jgi:CIC family chloride channel protein
MPHIRALSNAEMLLFLILGLLVGVIAPWFLRLLRGSETLFSKIPIPIYYRVALGGLVVGLLAVQSPEVCGNGYSVINRVLNGNVAWEALLLILVMKTMATSASFGSGAVGGVFTPTLFVGACLGELFGDLIHWVQSRPAPPSAAFALIGMGAFLAATTHAPLMAIIILFELTLDYDLILPLMLACVVAYYTSTAFEKRSIYSEALQRKGADVFRRRLTDSTVANLMKGDPLAVTETAPFSDIAANFLRNRFNYLYVVDEGRHFRGVISLHDIKSYLNDPDLAQLVIARDILREGFLTLAPGDTLATALERFSHHDGERLPVTSANDGEQLLGSLSKTDLLLALSEKGREGESGKAA